MRLFYDTEFVEDGRTIDLLSIGMVNEAGDEYYAVVEDLALITRAAANPWLRENVLSSLPVREYYTDDGGTRWDWWPDHRDFDRVKTRDGIADDVRGFVLSHPNPQLWAWYAAYDHVALAQLFGRMIDLPDGIPMFTCDLKQECVRLGDPRVPEQQDGVHNALADARHNRVIAKFLDGIDA